MKTPTPRPSILAIDPYVPGKATSAAPRIHKLSSNESALGPAPSAVRALREAADSLHLYPDGSAARLRARIGEVHGLDPAQLIVGNGSDELLALMVRSYTSPGDEVLMTRHGFSYYPLAAMAEGAVPVMAGETDLTADVDNLLRAVTDRTRLVFLANPNNPTGTRLPDAEVARLRAGLPSDVMLVLDAAYAEYIESDDYDPGARLVSEATRSGADNVVMTRTFSKIYGLGGMRVGWAYAPPSVIDVLGRVRGPFNVSAPGLAAAEAALGDADFVTRNRRHNAREMARILDALGEGGLAARASEANFILVELPGEAEARALLAACEERGVLLRGLASSNLPHMVRVSIGSEEANDAFLAAALDWQRSRVAR